jgi:tRNA(adenine34) deaminase
MIMLDDVYFMRAALQEAHKAYEEDEIPVGAVVVCNQRIIARSHNMTERLQDVTAHAEMLAITSAAHYLGFKYLNDCTLYVTLEPCVMCAGALFWSQLGRLVYGADDLKQGFSMKHRSLLHPKTIVSKGILAEDAGQLIRDFFSSKRS